MKNDCKTCSEAQVRDIWLVNPGQKSSRYSAVYSEPFVGGTFTDHDDLETAQAALCQGDKLGGYIVENLPRFEDGKQRHIFCYLYSEDIDSADARLHVRKIVAFNEEQARKIALEEPLRTGSVLISLLDGDSFDWCKLLGWGRYDTLVA